MTGGRRGRLRLLALAFAAGCASQGMPPGGPPDKLPPVLLTVTPDSGQLRVGLRQALTFRFDEVINERTRAGSPLDQAVVVSPSDGPVSVDWHRTSITVRARKGWRPDLAYTVTILSGLQDLSGNSTKQPLQTVFSTGSVIPHGEISGVVFDWMAQHVVSGARVEAMIGTDTVLKFTGRCGFGRALRADDAAAGSRCACAHISTRTAIASSIRANCGIRHRSRSRTPRAASSTFSHTTRSVRASRTSRQSIP